MAKTNRKFSFARSTTRRRNIGTATKALWKTAAYRSKVSQNLDRKAAGIKTSKTLRKQFALGLRELPTGGWRRIRKGWLRTAKGGRLFYRGSWEKAFIGILDACPLVKTFGVGPRIPYRFNRKVRTFFSDFSVELHDSRKFVVELKGAYARSPKTKAKVKAAKKFCNVKGLNFKLFLKKVSSISELTQ